MSSPWYPTVLPEALAVISVPGEQEKNGGPLSRRDAPQSAVENSPDPEIAAIGETTYSVPGRGVRWSCLYCSMYEYTKVNALTVSDMAMPGVFGKA